MVDSKFCALIVDDEIDFQQLFNIQFKQEIEAGSYHFYFADNGKKALEILETIHQELDLISIDLNMPFMNGHDLFEKITTQYPNLKTVIVSGLNKNAIKQDFVARGATALVSKPLDFFKFKILIEGIIKKKAINQTEGLHPLP